MRFRFATDRGKSNETFSQTQIQCQIPLESSREEGPRSEDNTRFTAEILSHSVAPYSLWLTCLNSIWKPQVTTHTRQHSLLINHIKGVQLIDHDMFFDTMFVFVLFFDMVHQVVAELL